MDVKNKRVFVKVFFSYSKRLELKKDQKWYTIRGKEKRKPMNT
jgi:hypothetical protein